MTSGRSRACLLLAAIVLLMPVQAWAQAGTTSGEFIVEPATLVSLGFEWKIAGDENRNARVDVSYRRVGEQARHECSPIRWIDRFPGEP